VLCELVSGGDVESKIGVNRSRRMPHSGATSRCRAHAVESLRHCSAERRGGSSSRAPASVPDLAASSVTLTLNVPLTECGRQRLLARHASSTPAPLSSTCVLRNQVHVRRARALASQIASVASMEQCTVLDAIALIQRALHAALSRLCRCHDRMWQFCSAPRARADLRFY
jgi:hypothetical protein